LLAMEAQALIGALLDSTRLAARRGQGPVLSAAHATGNLRRDQGFRVPLCRRHEARGGLRGPARCGLGALRDSGSVGADHAGEVRLVIVAGDAEILFVPRCVALRRAAVDAVLDAAGVATVMLGSGPRRAR
jgi:hypothetical protein